MSIVVSVVVEAPIHTVWDDLARLETHPEWMADAADLDFVSERRSGPGTEILVETRLGPLRTRDRMTFTEWVAPERMAVEHRGVVSGSGAFTLESIDPGMTRFTWEERLRFPWFLGGPVGAYLARPLLRAVWRRNLARFAARFSAR